MEEYKLESTKYTNIRNPKKRISDVKKDKMDKGKYLL